jgi:hypothetical protein
MSGPDELTTKSGLQLVDSLVDENRGHDGILSQVSLVRFPHVSDLRCLPREAASH